MKKMLAIVLALVLCLSCCSALAEDKLYIGIIQLMPHIALDQAWEGFVQALKDKGYEDGVNITLNYQNGQGDASIADQFVGDNADLVLAIATMPPPPWLPRPKPSRSWVPPSPLTWAIRFVWLKAMNSPATMYPVLPI